MSTERNNDMITARKYRRGFTLVEVMAAVVVLGIGIAAVLSLIGKSTRAVTAARTATLQTSLARMAMVEIENKYWRKQAEEIETLGDFGEDFPDFRYEVLVTEDIDEEVPALHEVQVIVYYDGTDPPREFSLTTLLIDFSQ